MEDSLIIGYDSGYDEDFPMLVSMRDKNDDIEMLVMRHGDEAMMLHRILTDQSCKFKIEIFKG